MIKEVCCASLDAVQHAAATGKQRVELCAALEVGGVTPSAGMVEEALREDIPINVLVRPRSGNFVYSEAEVEAMCSDVRRFAQMGVNGVVIGALTAAGDIDVDATRRMMQAAGTGVEITFHRAFDECRDAAEALEQLIRLGCHRVLTSGQAPTAPEGAPLLRQLVAQARGRIIILAGGGVTPENCEQLARDTGVSEVHGSRL